MASSLPVAATSTGEASKHLENENSWVLILYASIMVGGLYPIVWLSRTYDLGTAPRVMMALAWLATLPLALRHLYYPGKIARGSSRIFASSPEVIWNTIVPRDTTDYYRASVSRIVRVCDEPEIYEFALRDLHPACLRCGLPHAPNRTKVKYLSEVVEKVPGRLLMTRAVGNPKGMRPIAKGGDCSLWEIVPHGTGSVVTYTNIVDQPRLWYWLRTQFKHTHIGIGMLSDLQSLLEGTPGVGSFAAAREWLAASRRAPEHCSCH